MSSVEGKEYWQSRSSLDERKDWRNGADTWLEEYILSATHPHRALIMDALRGFRGLNSVLEIGCNTGPNLLNIRSEFPKVVLNGIDINLEAIAHAKTILPEATLLHWEAKNLPFSNKSIDVVIADAVFMYVEPQEIKDVFEEINRVSRRGVIIVDWDASSVEGIVRDGHWARNYKKLLKQIGYKVTKQKLTFDNWPNERWAKNGYVFIGKK